MADKNLSDDMVKLVDFTIVTIKRGHESILCSGKKLVEENMTGEAFASWVVAEHGPRNGSNGNGHEDPLEQYDGKDQYLRVYYNVLDRWPKQDLKYEEKQLKVLSGIERAILARP